MKLELNQKNAMQLLIDSFSGRTTFVGELLQNARRAGADAIDVVHHGGWLSVSDNGIGVEDFSKLLTICESGWDTAVVESDSPYGVGFLSAIMASSKFVVISQGKTMTAVTAELLHGGSPIVKDTVDGLEPGFNTTIRLELRDPKMDLRNKIEVLASGFPAAIHYNGVRMGNPLAISEAVYKHDIPGFGTLVWDGSLPNTYLTSVPLFLQGVVISPARRVDYLVSDAQQRYGAWRGFGFHLDSTKFHGRMPDREQLIDGEHELDADFATALRGAQRTLVIQALEAANWRPSYQLYRLLQDSRLFDLIDQVVEVPEIFKTADSEICHVQTEWDNDFMSCSGESIHRDDDLSNIWICSEFSGGPESGDDVAAMRVMHEHGVLFPHAAIPKWLGGRWLEYQEVKAVPLQRKDDEFTAIQNPMVVRLAGLDVVRCDAVEVQLLDEDGNVLMSHVEDEFCPTIDGTLYYCVKGADNYFFMQDYDYVDEDRQDWDWDELGKLRIRFELELEMLDGADPKLLLEQQLKYFDDKRLAEKQYAVIFTASGRVESIRELKGEEA